MNRFKDLPNNNQRNTYSSNRDNSNNRFGSSNAFKQNRNNSRFSSTSTSSSQFGLQTNNRWKKDNTDSVNDRYSNRNDRYSNRNDRYSNRRFGSNFNRRNRPNDSRDVESKFIDLKSMSRGFDVITTKPKQNKNKKQNKKKSIQETNTKLNKKTNTKLDKEDDGLSKDDEKSLNSWILNQYEYEVIEETESEGEGEENNEDELESKE